MSFQPSFIIVYKAGGYLMVFVSDEEAKDARAFFLGMPFKSNLILLNKL
jgi:hypothetical protein